jgi:hypothetical protein
MSHRLLILAAIWIAAPMVGPSTAQESPSKPLTGGMPQSVEEPNLVVTRTLLLRPGNADQQPAFDRLYPAPDKWTQGDAAPIFLRMNWEASSRIKALQDLRRQIDLDTPLEQLDLDLIERSFAINLQEMRRFAYRERANWQYPLHEGPVYEVLLPDVQESRNYSHALAIKARSHLVRGESGQAEQLICMTTGLARHIAETPFVVSRLVATAQSNVAMDVIEELLQISSAGNYYWDLASLPRPMIDFRTAIQFERDWIWRGVPELEAMERLETKSQWEQAAMALYRLLELPAPGTPESEAVIGDWTKISRERLPGRLQSTAPTLAGAVGSMSDAEVAVRYWMIRQKEESSLAATWSMLEPQEAIKRWDEEARKQWARTDDELLVQKALRPMLALMAGSRLDQRVAMLRGVEAIRDHLAIHRSLPASLDDLRLPVPLDPVTAKPFLYQVDVSGKEATLASPVVEVAQFDGDPGKWKYGRKYLLKVSP